MWWKYTAVAGIVLTMLTLARQLGGFENKELALWLLVFAAAVFLFFLGLAVRDFILRHRRVPDHCPKVVPDHYGVTPGRITTEGLHVVNDGESGFEVGIPPIDLADGWVLHFDEVHNRIGPKEKAFFQAVVSKGNDNHLGLDGVWRHLKQTADVSAVLPFFIKYRDSSGHWYRSICEFHRDVMKNYPGFDAMFIRQETI